MITYYIQYQRKLMFSGDIELNTGHTPVLYFCNSVQNNSPTKLSLNVVLEAKVKMLSVNANNRIPTCPHYIVILLSNINVFV